ncbi:MAG: hypothetical protein UZ01_02525 [Candidatus Brocadia sinica]|nr:MAG: hypothetical protein UZ01_02525 [Candidatus Brocadia sinica]
MMVVPKLINQIQELGYRFELIGDNIKFVYTKGSQPPKEAIPILLQVKERKQEIIEYLQRQSKPGTEEPITGRYEPTEADRRLERYISKPSENPKGYKCSKCGGLGERYCLGQGRDARWYWSWRCLKCSPYSDN